MSLKKNLITHWNVITKAIWMFPDVNEHFNLRTDTHGVRIKAILVQIRGGQIFILNLGYVIN